jgi:hypothetical protein
MKVLCAGRLSGTVQFQVFDLFGMQRLASVFKSFLIA